MHVHGNITVALEVAPHSSGCHASLQWLSRALRAYIDDPVPFNVWPFLCMLLSPATGGNPRNDPEVDSKNWMALFTRTPISQNLWIIILKAYSGILAFKILFGGNNYCLSDIMFQYIHVNLSYLLIISILEFTYILYVVLCSVSWQIILNEPG